MGEFRGVELNDLVLAGDRLTLRPWRPADADVVFEAMQHRRMHEFLPLPDPYTRADALAFTSGVGDEGRADGTGIGGALVETGSGRVVGSAALRLPKPRHVTAEIGYAVYPAGQGHGYAAEASRVLATWAFAHGIARVEIRCAVGNLASVKSALAAGFRFEGVLRQDVAVPGGSADGALFARIPTDADRPIARVVAPLPAAGLSDGVLTLRPLMPGDEISLGEQEGDALTRQWEFNSHTRTIADHAEQCSLARLHWLVGPVLRCAVVDAASGGYAGMINVRLLGPPQVGGVGYAVHPSFRGRGFTARALALLREWAFTDAGFARLELGAKTDNIASQKAALSGGFQPDGVRVARLRNPDGTFSDEVRFAAVNPRIRPAQ